MIIVRAKYSLVKYVDLLGQGLVFCVSKGMSACHGMHLAKSGIDSAILHWTPPGL